MKLDRTAVIENYVNTLDELSRAASRRSFDNESFAFLYGYTQSDVLFMLESLDLTQKQLSTLNNRLVGMEENV